MTKTNEVEVSLGFLEDVIYVGVMMHHIKSTHGSYLEKNSHCGKPRCNSLAHNNIF